ncbi:two-component regulator propeller domain-containing protein [Meiothermus sp. QL-1]|uniref:two-component regulator propeller domain-containing protein n=1 Tax=Meiothermus sp. QL-1 TaxID=2058095 RepID=UPI0013140CC2|nr:two-component regulator propeller domain-containing protein [Meiothermus sp. QL-1]
MRLYWFFLFAFWALFFVACSGGGTQAQGQLLITITGLPSGVDADVQVTGPNGFSRALTQSTSPALSVTPGQYTITARDVVAAGRTYTATVSPGTTVSVAASQTTQVGVAYAEQTPSGGVDPAKTFTASLGIGSLAFQPGGRLYASGNAAGKTDPSGRLYLTPADLGGAGGAVPAAQVATEAGLYRLAFSASGALYELKRDDLPPASSVYIRRYDPATATANAFSPVELVIPNGAFSFGSPPVQDYNLYKPSDMALDAQGNLWVLDPESTARSSADGIPNAPGRLACYSAADQAAAIPSPGNLGTPGRIYYGSAIEGARALAFDAQGNLWLAGGSGSTARLVRIAAGALSCPNLGPSGNPANEELALGASGVTELRGAPLTSPVDLAIHGGDLYVAQSDGASLNNILRLSTNATSIPSNLVPITINGLQGQITSLAVDAGGNLWVGTAGAPAPSPGRIYRLP